MSRELKLTQVKDFLSRVTDGVAAYTAEASKELQERFVGLVDTRMATPRGERKFSINMSGIGRPLCQLQMQKAGVKPLPQPYFASTRNLYGDLIEGVAIATLKSAGVEVLSHDVKCTLSLLGQRVRGIYDIELDDGIYDIKTASGWMFKNKYNNESAGFQTMLQDDPFGYIVQGYMYAAATDKKFKGWIVINKENGEWEITETPDDVKYFDMAMAKAEKTVKSIQDKLPFERQYTAIEETYNRKPTGNKVLGFTCSYCDYKETCWPGAVNLPSIPSKAQRPAWKWYTEIKDA